MILKRQQPYWRKLSWHAFSSCMRVPTNHIQSHERLASGFGKCGWLVLSLPQLSWLGSWITQLQAGSPFRTNWSPSAGGHHG